MSQVNAPVDFRNRMLRAVPPDSLERLQPDLEPVTLSNGQVLSRVGETVDFFYFADQGLISRVKPMRDGHVIEVGAFGTRGMTTPHALLEVNRAILDNIVLIAGTAHRIRREPLMREVERSAPLRELVRMYAHYSLGQLAQTAACNALHSTEQRCCRWLLVAHDNACGDTFDLTQESLSMMLGVQRTVVSTIAHQLKDAGLIDYSRGQMTIKSRQGIEETACECYREMRVGVDHLFDSIA
jgi:CRP-like cAMP-binding protein